MLHRARSLGVVPIVPADVVAEWWRGRSDIREHILPSVIVEPLTECSRRRESRYGTTSAVQVGDRR